MTTMQQDSYRQASRGTRAHMAITSVVFAGLLFGAPVVAFADDSGQGSTPPEII